MNSSGLAGLLLLSSLFTIGCTTQRMIEPGIVTQSTVFEGGEHQVEMHSLADSVFLYVHGDDVILDFNHAVIDGRTDKYNPASFEGIGLYIYHSRNVTIRNLSIHGFKIAILAENVENLQIENCNVSYNYRPRLYSQWDREALSDWLYFHHNEDDEWKRYGAAIYLKNCDKAVAKNILCHNGMNGLLMVQCENAWVYNNDIRFNSGIGIGLYRSSFNKIMHNRLEWNARGFSYMKYARGQDSAAILLYEQSSHNIIAYNSATHCGDGLFLWAGQYTMDTGLGGCDSNLIYRNDFSHSIANGVEATFSANWIVENKLNDSRYGVWAGYSHHTYIAGNEIRDCEYGIAIEHGSYNIIEKNRIAVCRTGVQLWERAGQPSDWGYAQINNVSSRYNKITSNHFVDVVNALEISNTDSLFLGPNAFENVGEVILSPKGPSEIIEDTVWLAWISRQITLPNSPEDAVSTGPDPGLPQGRKYLVINEWGPYDFQYPVLVLRDRMDTEEGQILSFEIFGPTGRWRVDTISGVKVDRTSGSVPDSLVAYRNPDDTFLFIRLTFVGDQCISQYGDTVPAGTEYPFEFIESTVNSTWAVAFYDYNLSSGMPDSSFSNLFSGDPVFETQYNQLAFRWWGKPESHVPEDAFAIRASTQFSVAEGIYRIRTESDDGIRLRLDGELILDRWDVHTPAMDMVEVSLTTGEHRLEVEYFEATGLAVLDVSVERMHSKK